MSIVSRLSLLLSVLLCAVPDLRAQGEPQEPLTFIQQFGVPDEVGSMRAQFSRKGAGMTFLQLTDHYPGLKERDHEKHEAGDYLLLVDDPNHAFRLTQAAGGAFAVDPGFAVWRREDVADGVKFTLDDGKGLVLEKVLRHDAKARALTMEVTLRNVASPAVGKLSFQLNGPALYNPSSSSVFGDVSVAIAVAQDETHEHLKPAVGQIQALKTDPRVLSFCGSTNRFFASFLTPLDDASRNALTQFEVYTQPGDTTADPVTAPSTRLIAGLDLPVPAQNEATTLRYELYFGPKSSRVFETLPNPERYEPILDIDLTAPCCGFDVPGGKQIAWLLLKLLGFFHDLIGNWGFAVILLTILVRGALFPLNFHMQKSMRKFGAKMAKLKPKMDEMKKKYADDPKAYQQAMLQFNREHGVMPPLGGCLPILLTMPIYIGLFTALRTAYDLRQQPFLGWIHDLSASDAAATLPFFPHVFNLLPILWVVLFLFMVLRQPLPTDPQQRQMQQMMRFMPLLFAVFLYNYASALLLYMVTSMLWSLVETAVVKKVLGPMDPNAGVMAPTPM